MDESETQDTWRGTALMHPLCSTLLGHPFERGATNASTTVPSVVPRMDRFLGASVDVITVVSGATIDVGTAGLVRGWMRK
jgi:hypothetical protein